MKHKKIKVPKREDYTDLNDFLIAVSNYNKFIYEQDSNRH